MRIRIEIEADSAKELLSELSKIVEQNSVDEAEILEEVIKDKIVSKIEDENQEALQEEAKAERLRKEHKTEGFKRRQREKAEKEAIAARAIQVAGEEKALEAKHKAEKAKTTELGAKHLMTEITAQIMEKGREHGKQIKAWITDEYEVSKASEVPPELRDEFLAKLEAL